MKISLDPELERFVQEKVRTGQYADPTEVVSGALTMLREQEQLTPQDVEELRRAIAVGIEQLDRGEGAPWDMEAIKAEGRARLAARNSKG